MKQTKSYTVKDFYKSYMEYIDNVLYEVDYATFRGIVTDYFKHIRDGIIEDGQTFKIPCRLGTLSIVKHKPKQWNGESLRIDFKTSQDLGKIIYHLNEHSGGFKYRFHWSKIATTIPNKIQYQLIVTRENKRRLAQIIKNGERDYIEI